MGDLRERFTRLNCPKIQSYSGPYYSNNIFKNLFFSSLLGKTKTKLKTLGRIYELASSACLGEWVTGKGKIDFWGTAWGFVDGNIWPFKKLF